MKSLTALIAESGLSLAEVARRAGVSRTTVSRIVHGKQQMSADTGQRLASALGLPPEAVTNARTTQPAEPEIIRITTSKITAWGTGEKGDRQLPELMTRLIRAELFAVGGMRGPSERETVQPGPDIKVIAPRRTRHVPQGESVWEVSTRKDVSKKAKEDIESALARFKGDGQAKRTHFVFVTTQSWGGAANWKASEAKKKQWASISVYDVTDLQAWLEEFMTVQLWFKDRAGISHDEIEWLETYVDRWCKASSPKITTSMLGQSVARARRSWQAWRNGMYKGPIAVRGGSVGEAALLIQALIEDERTGDKKTGTASVHDIEGTVVHTKGALTRLVEGRTDNLVVIPARGLEDDAVGMADAARIALPTTRRVRGSQAVEVIREPYRNMAKCLQDLGIDPGKAKQLARASGGSPNALRRINYQQQALNRPGLPKHLQRVAAVAGLVGKWDARRQADIEAIRRLAKLDTADSVDEAWRDLAMLDEPMTWSENSLRGVNNRLDAWLRATMPYATGRIIEDYIQLTQLALMNVDQVMEREFELNDERDAIRHGEHRISMRMLDGLCKGLILLREYADEFDYQFFGSGCVGLVSQTVYKTLSATTSNHLQAISNILPSLAEASPESFLNILEEDAEDPCGAQRSLLTGDLDSDTREGMDTKLDFNWYMIDRRTSLMQAYECLGWFQEFAPRAIDVLANLAETPIQDHHGGQPKETLSNMLKAWIKGCCLTTEGHIEALTKLVQNHSNWGVEFVMNMLPTGYDSASPTSLPKWRGELDGAGSQISKDHRIRVIRHAAQLVQEHTTDSMETVVSSLQAIPYLPQKMTKEIWRKITNWVRTEELEDDQLDWLSRRLHQIGDGADSQYKRTTDMTAAKEAARCLRTRMGVVPDIWIFDQNAVIMERNSEDEHWEDTEQRLAARRRTAIIELIQRDGLNSIWQLLLHVPEPYMVGTICGQCLVTKQIRALVDTYVERDFSSVSSHAERFMLGLMFEEDRGSIEGHIEHLQRRILTPIREYWKADLLAKCRIAESYTLFEQLTSTEKTTFWKTYQPIREVIPEDLHDWLARGLADVQRPRTALWALRGDLDHIETATLVQLTNLLPESTEDGYQFWDEELVDETRKRTDLPLAQAIRIEFQYFGLLERKGLPALAKAIARDPNWLKEALMLCMKRRDHEPEVDVYWQARRENTPEALRQQAYRLFEWLPELPGFDDAGNFRLETALGWTKSILDFAEAHNRLEVAQTLIGHAFAAAGMNDDQEPITELVELLEALHNQRIEEGVAIAAGNQVGATWLPDDEPSRPDRERSERYYKLERRYHNHHPRTARVMRLLKEHFSDAAKVAEGITRREHLEDHDY